MSTEKNNFGASTGPIVSEAASLIVHRHNSGGGGPQILFVERSKQMRFAGGMTVFPGGRVDQADTALGAKLAPGLDPADARSRIAAIRETLEETGLLVGVRETVTAGQAAEARSMLMASGELEAVLQNLGWTLDLECLVPFARWLPKHHKDRAFDTRFYLADLGSGNVDIAIDETENHHLFWAAANEALRLADEGSIGVIYPTRRNLERLGQFPTFAACADHARSIEVRPITPIIKQVDGENWMHIPDDAGYPVTAERMAH